MKSRIALLAFASVTALSTPGWALTGTQTGASGTTYASAGVQCAINPTTGMGPMVQTGLYNPKKNARASVLLNGNPVATVTFASPDATVWLENKANTVAVGSDSYPFDATPSSGQLNVCIPSTAGNTMNGTVEYSASNKSYATITPGCAVNPSNGKPQPFVNLIDNGSYLLNVSINYVPLTQLNGTTRKSTPVFLAPGKNVISAANGSVSTDYYVRDGGTGSCTLN